MAEPGFAADSRMSSLPIVVDEIRVSAARLLDPNRRSDLGQYFTPWPIARLMASMSHVEGRHVRLLDPGAGTGILSAAWLAEQCARKRKPREVHVVAYEIDPALLASLRRTLETASDACSSAGMSVTWEVRNSDFVAAATRLIGTIKRDEWFDVAVLNPPYRKIRSDSKYRSVLRTIGIETSNLYAAFVTLSMRLLDKKGDLIAITPRSFCNGPYFKPFRFELLKTLNLRHIHVFASRDRAFAEDAVLQENIILHGVKGEAQAPEVVVSCSDDADDPKPVSQSVAFDQVVRPDDREAFIQVVPDERGNRVAHRSRRMPCTLADLELSVSTGRVVDFRASEFLLAEARSGSVPLIYPRHFDRGFITWPRPHLKKADAIKLTNRSRDVLVRAGIYVLVKRFSAKEERRRIVAAVYDADRVPGDLVGFENHLNYFHRRGNPLPRSLAVGLTAYLNSTFVDEHFRQFSGHTQVNATDLRTLRFPTERALLALGELFATGFPEQEELDNAVDDVLACDEADYAAELPLGV